MEIIHFAAECYPVAKVGGLADVVGALPKYQCQAGHYAKVVMPAYDTRFMHQNSWQNDYQGYIYLGNLELPYTILRESTNKLGYDLYCVYIQGLTDRKNIYSEHDDTERFFAFQLAALDWINQWQHLPDILHCHDHHTALIPFLKQYAWKFQKLRNIKTVFTIHNGLYQGWFSWNKLHYFPAFDTWKSGLLDWAGTINPMSSAVRCADAITTVSPSYMRELQYSSYGLEILFQQLSYKCYGILNGIDYEVWNPATDTYLDKHYTIDNVNEVKAQHKQEICETFRLNPDNPLIAFIGRLVHEKGADLLPQAMGQAMYETQGRICFIALGSGSSQIEYELERLKIYCPGIFNCYIGYHEALSHKIYAAADFLLMPSRVEPCGLNQMYALRYGTIPIVRRVGGLQDTVQDIGEWEGFGICFQQPNVLDIIHATHRATYLYYYNFDFLKSLRQRIMTFDNSWQNSQRKYEQVYRKILQEE
ncbi:MAG: glycogen/starch synthase [Microscillaceae bacterium]|nr:glycogen/starch synthase [Microscillaceae bacterium]MDW8460801.1 glycogen/starch synthase [Cytophagales bacterium]